MTTIQLDNQNKTKVNFSYDNGLPYKKSIRPDMEYGDWTEDTSKILLKVMLSERDYNLFKNPNEIRGLGFYILSKEIWFDLEDVYLVIDIDQRIIKKIKQDNFIIAFLYNNELISSLS